VGVCWVLEEEVARIVNPTRKEDREGVGNRAGRLTGTIELVRAATATAGVGGITGGVTM